VAHIKNVAGDLLLCVGEAVECIVLRLLSFLHLQRENDVKGTPLYLKVFITKHALLYMNAAHHYLL